MTMHSDDKRGWTRRQAGLGLAATALSLAGCGGGSDGDGITTDPITPPTTAQPNILLVIADDMGVDASNQYSYSSDRPATPTLDALASAGIVFDNVWATPACTTTRATIITGQHGVHSGVDFVPDVMDTSANTIQRYLGTNAASAAYQTAVIGKWHLAGGGNVSVSHPIDSGVGYYAGNIAGVLPSYTSWPLVENGVAATSTEYHTTKVTDLALSWVRQQSKPWFLWLAYSAPHDPFHLPPANLHRRTTLTGTTADIAARPREYYLAAIEAMDTEIGRLLAGLSAEVRANTIILFIGDNGSPAQVFDQAVFARGKVKGTVYEGGIRVPMIVSGKGVARSNVRESALINTSDFYATIANLAGNAVTQLNDGYSFVPLLQAAGVGARSFNYSEYKATGFEGWTVRDANYKLIQRLTGEQELYDLRTDFKEEVNLLASGTDYSATVSTLRTQGERIRA
jgi:arylsulfatase A-like enzyme